MCKWSKNIYFKTCLGIHMWLNERLITLRINNPMKEYTLF